MATHLDQHPISKDGQANCEKDKIGTEPFFQARLSKQMSSLLQEWNETPRLAWELANLDSVIQVDQAHIVMLAEQGLLTPAQAGGILQSLETIMKDGPQAFAVHPGYGSIVLQIEQKLSALLGEDVAGRMPIGRSRLDQGATVKRLVDRSRLLDVHEAILVLQSSMLKVAHEQSGTSMISYTHLQQAQPANFGHYLLAFVSRLEDTQAQLQQLYERVDRSPLGTAGLSGTDLPINRQRTADLLGFSGLVDNARTARDAYYQAEISFVLAMIMTVLNDLCSDLHIFSSIEFGTVEIDDSHCSTSSVFPQKKNPYALETVKGKAGDASGWVTIALATLRNEGTSDTQARTVSCLTEAYRTTIGMLQLTSEVVTLMTVSKERWEQHLSKAWVTTNRLGNILLTKHGLDYRTAHALVARLVKSALTSNVNKSGVSLDMLHKAAADMNLSASISLTEQELADALDHSQFINTATSEGGVSPNQVQRLQRVHQSRLLEGVSWAEKKSSRLLRARTDLRDASGSLVNESSV